MEKTVIVDESFATTGQGYHLTRVHHIGDYTLRVDIKRDAYAAQSYAMVQVLTPALTWTTLASDPPSRWHGASLGPASRPKPGPRVLYPLADQLACRATTILRAAPPAAATPAEPTA
jgi:hypothetical protein